MAAAFSLHRPTREDWAAIRDLRIRAVSDTPMAYLETLEQVLALDENGWRERVGRNQHADATQVVAVAPDGRWIGNMVCFVSDGPPSYVVRREPPGRRATLVGVFVDPEWR
jgi:GNAT superfamily N-acetyltransferase